MKYNCNKTLDYDHEVNRMCKTIPTSPIGKCPNCPLANIGGCTPGNGLTQKTIDIVQKWSDEHPEQPKLTRKERDFLDCFYNNLGMAICKTEDNRLLVALSDMWGIRLDNTMFPFIEKGDKWYFDKLLGLEVEE